MEIWADILKAVENEADRGGTARATRVRSAANLPYDRFCKHVAALAKRGLVATDPLELTAEGSEFLRMAHLMRGAGWGVRAAFRDGTAMTENDAPREDEPIGL